MHRAAGLTPLEIVLNVLERKSVIAMAERLAGIKRLRVKAVKASEKPHQRRGKS